MKKDQFVIACIESPADAATLIPYAQHCARSLNNKGLLLLNVSREGQSEWLKDYGIPYIGLKGEWKAAIDTLPTALNAILAVALVKRDAPTSSITHPRTFLRAFRHCRVAYVACCGQWTEDRVQWPQTTLLTLDHSRESKEKFIWASYLVRHLHTRLTVAIPNYNDSLLQQRCNNNLRALDKLFDSLDISYTPLQLPSVSLSASPDMLALQEMQPDMLLTLTTDPRQRHLIDWLRPTAEQRILERPLTTLFLNPRDDLYVLCD